MKDTIQPAHLRTSATENKFASLPPELLHVIASYIPISARMSLKLVNKHLCGATPLPADYDGKVAFHQLSLCEKIAIRRSLNERSDLESGRRRCLLCNTPQPLGKFPDDGVTCDWHDRRLMEVSLPASLDEEMRERLLRLSGEANMPYWVRLRRILCVHSRKVVCWEVGDCGCRCGSCPHAEVDCCVRIAAAEDVPSTWEIELLEGRGRHVRETYGPAGVSARAGIDRTPSDGGPAVPGEARLGLVRSLRVVALEEAELQMHSV